MLVTDELVSAIRAALPGNVAFAGGLVAGAAGKLFPIEEAALRSAVQKRRDEFRAGRTYAREALAALGVDAGAIPVGGDRAPVWPSGVVASITHTDRYCGVVAARAREYTAVGIDMETAAPLDEGLVCKVCFGAELRDRVRVETRLRADLPALIFAVKESVYKAYAPTGGRFLDFSDVVVSLDAEQRTFVAQLVLVSGASSNGASPSGASRNHPFSGGFLTRADIVVAWTIVRHAAVAP